MAQATRTWSFRSCPMLKSLPLFSILLPVKKQDPVIAAVDVLTAINILRTSSRSTVSSHCDSIAFVYFDFVSCERSSYLDQYMEDFEAACLLLVQNKVFFSFFRKHYICLLSQSSTHDWCSSLGTHHSGHRTGPAGLVQCCFLLLILLLLLPICSFLQLELIKSRTSAVS